MSPKQRSSAAKNIDPAPVFAALGDRTRLSLVKKLAEGDAQSISKLTEGTSLTRQAVTKHLAVLEDVGIVQNIRSGRESLYQLRPEPFRDLQEYLDLVSTQWSDALNRLKSFVED